MINSDLPNITVKDIKIKSVPSNINLPLTNLYSNFFNKENQAYTTNENNKNHDKLINDNVCQSVTTILLFPV